MSDITYTPENHSKLDEWIDSCPRELANLISIIAFQNKGDGTMAQIGIYSVLNTSRENALQMLDDAIANLQNRRNEILEESRIYRLQQIIDKYPM